jgi:alpha-glucosidase (family GH31 glycosyl hydrolase)
MTGWMKTILNPMERAGVDFWWLDWQQHPFDNKVKTLSNTWWLNYCFFTDMERNNPLRPMLYHRWGGLGNHRYQIGFSGDSSITWASLDFQPYFNSTASNVLYGYWSHDIGGHHFGIGRIEPEMFVRWMQFGALSPILRTHSTKNENLKKEPWSFDKAHFNILRDIIKQRYAMSPYIYTMARKTYEEGLSMCRPMYYDYPENQEAYDFRNEYMFGDNILVMPITQPMDGEYSVARVWLPAGNDWYEVHSGTMLKGGQIVERSFAIDEYPMYVKAGSVIPMAQGLKNLRKNDFAYEINVYPGAQGEFTVYEDNGNDKNYANEYATTRISAVNSGKVLTVTIDPRQGCYKDMPASREMTVKVNGYKVPESVTLDGKALDWSYDGTTMSLIAKLPDASCNTTKTIQITYPSTDNMAEAGTIAKFRHLYKATIDLKNKRAGMLFKEPLARLESAGRNISYHPGDYESIMKQFNEDYANLPNILKDHDMDDEMRAQFLKTVNM